MSAMQKPDTSIGTSVERYTLTPPAAFLTLKSLNAGNSRSMFEPLVTGPSWFHWKMARTISAKPSVAIAR